jgi:peptide/nickel transport system permease protein
MTLLKRIAANRQAALGLGLLAAFILTALLGPTLVMDPEAFLATPHAAPSIDHWFGTTGQGQDVLAQTIVGTRSSMFTGLAVGLLVVFLGAAVGVTAGMMGGWVDQVLSLITNVFLIIPGLPLAIVLAAYLPSGPITIAFVLTITGWAWNARVLRAQTMSLRERDFVAAARVAGEHPMRIVFMELVPNMASIMVGQLMGGTIYAIGAQVGLEFIGLGDPSQITWGTNLYWAANDQALLTGSWWTFVPTGVCIALVGFGLTLINFGVDEITNPRLAAERAWRSALRRGGVTPVEAVTPVCIEEDAP